MSVQIVKDIQEALLREIADLSTHVQDTKTNVSTQTTFDVFTGEALPLDIEGNLYNEKSNPNEIQYPRVDLEYTGLREDRESGRMISIWEDLDTEYRSLIWPNQNRPTVYDAVITGADGLVTAFGLQVPRFKYSRMQTNYLVKILSGTNKGTYAIQALNDLTSTIELQDVLVAGIQELSFNEQTRRLYLLNPADTYSVRAGDVFVDADANEFEILHIDTAQREIYLDGSNVPSLDVGSYIKREGSVLKNYDAATVSYVIMDPDRPKSWKSCPLTAVTDSWDSSHYATPFDYYFTLEIKNKDRQSHIAMVDQMTSTLVNRTRRQLTILVREQGSAETVIMEGPDTGFGQSIVVKDASKLRVNDSVWCINKYSISENNQIIDIDYETNTVTLRNKLPVQFNFKNKARIVANARLKSWGMLLNNEDINIGQDNINNFYRQEYTFRIQGYKAEKSGVKTTSGITGIDIELESVNNAKVDIKV